LSTALIRVDPSLSRPGKHPVRCCDVPLDIEPWISNGVAETEVQVNEAEARELLAAKMVELRRLPYAGLLRFFEVEAVELTGESGAVYQVEVEAYWDDRRRGHVLVMAAIDDGRGWRAFVPMTDAFIVAPDGSFIGE
jgi:hypothetical protein